MFMFVLQRLEGIPRSVLVLYPFILAMGLAGPRLFYRWIKDRHLNLKAVEGKRALLIGAGRAGELLVRDLLKSGPYEVAGFLDDADRRQGQEIHGVRVIGRLTDLEQVARQQGVEVVLLAIPSASHQVIQSVVQRCASLDIPCRILPSVAELADGRVQMSHLRQVQIEDLLGRDAVDLDYSGIRHLLAGQSVLVTGAGGSIGSELCRQVLQQKPSQLLLLDHSEFNLYTIDQKLREKGARQGVAVSAILADIRDEPRMRWVLEHFQPNIVFNAAAYKHVPLVEENPAEGVKTNVLGTCQVADLAVEFGVQKFVQVSTDKAVNPTNVMGASKRTAEVYCQNLNGRSEATAFITTRFGNVLGSAGSVVPLFRKQIEAGGPVTVTHPDMMRYFMTIPEAVSLILQAASMGHGGEIFVLDMGEPVKITDLAEQMIRLSGLQPGVDIEITYTGLRPGEKMYEELFYDAEKLQPTGHAKIMLARATEVSWQVFSGHKDALAEACGCRDIEAVRRLLRNLVPEYSPDMSDASMSDTSS